MVLNYRELLKLIIYLHREFLINLSFVFLLMDTSRGRNLDRNMSEGEDESVAQIKSTVLLWIYLG